MTKTPKQWQWLYSPILNQVYKNSMEEGSIQMFAAPPQQRRLRSPKYYSIGNCDILPEDVERTTITDKGNFVWCQGSQPCLQQIDTLRTLRSTIHKNDQWAIRKIHYQDNGKNLAQALIQGTAVAVCDGSYKDHFGTAGFVMQGGNNDEDRIVGAHVTPGHPDKSNAYRSELGRILAIVIVTEAIAKLHGIQEGKIELGCDCESGIIAIFEHTYDTQKQPHHDLIHEIRKKLSHSRLKWIPCHVDGHQDKHTSYLRLDMWGQLNVEMDS
jgi:hypothetical protein